MIQKLIRNVFILFLLMGLSTVLVNAQTTISGNITDENGESLAGVTVLEKGTGNGTITDMNGDYSITVAEDAVLVVSYVGYISEEFTVQGRTDFNVILVPDMIGLEEIVVVGYGSVKRSDLTGAVGTVRPEELTQLATINVQQAMQGRVAGVMIMTNTGEPGSDMKVRIRGTSTINNSDPLYVVDGFPTDDIGYLNPSDVESMEILKDASATAIYGNRGANGVVLISTKKGQEQQTTINVNMYTGIQTVNKKVDLLNATEFAQAKIDAYDNAAIIEEEPSLSLSYDPFNAKDTLFRYIIANNLKGTDWQDEVMQRGAVQNYTVSISGGGENYKYRASGSYYNEDGIIINSWLRKYLFNLSGQYTLSKRIDVEANIAYMNLKQTNYDQNIYGQGILPPALYGDPVSPAYIPGTNDFGGVNVSGSTNPVAAADRMRYNKTWEDQVVGNTALNIDIIKGLTFTSRFGADAWFQRPRRYLPAYEIGDKDLNTTSSLDETHQRNFSWNNSNYINYNKDIGNHSISLMLGQEWQYEDSYRTRLVTFNVPDDPNLHFATAADAETPADINQGVTQENRYEWQSTLASYFGRMNYVFDERYLLTLTFRRDASSKIAEEYRWGSFPSFSAGWNIKNESFLEGVEFISNLKLRAGWGKTGNQGSVVDIYSLYPQVTPGLFIIGEGNTQLDGSMQTTTPNPKLQWEEVSQWNYGLDFSLFSNKLSGTVDYYDKTTTGMIVNVPPPIFTGMNASNANVGEMSNSGLEITLSYRNYEGEFDYEMGGNVTFLSKPMVESLAEEDQDIMTGTARQVQNVIRTIAGEEMAHFYGYETDGLLTQDDIDNTTGIDEEGDVNYTYDRSFCWPGQLKLVDQNGDGNINDDDKVNIGSANPDYILGFNANFMYKGFDLKMFWQGIFGHEMVNTINTVLLVPVEGDQNLASEVMDAWKEDPNNPGFPIEDTDVPRLVQGNNIFQNQFNDYLVEDASFLRLKNVQLGYTLPKEITQRFGVKHLRFYISAENLITITKYSGFDPEVGDFQFSNDTQQNDPLTQGLDDAYYPLARRFLFGINLQF